MELFKKILAGCGADFDRPLERYMREKERGNSLIPYIPEVKILPLHKLCRQAILWSCAGFKQQASRMCPFLLRAERFGSFWCPENEFNETEQHLFYFLSNLERTQEAPYEFDAQFLENDHMQSLFTASGYKGSPVGILLTDKAQIVAMGPQSLPLSVPNRFGIDGEGMQSWSRMAACPEVWLHTECKLTDEALKVHVRFVGVEARLPTAWTFYVKSPSCRVGSSFIKSKSLQQYSGEARSVTAHNLRIENKSVSKIQVVPLAGGGGFWNADFLISFEVQPLEPELSFVIEIAK